MVLNSYGQGQLSWERWQEEIVALLRDDFAQELQRITTDDVDWQSWREFYRAELPAEPSNEHSSAISNLLPTLHEVLRPSLGRGLCCPVSFHGVREISAKRIGRRFCFLRRPY